MTEKIIYVIGFFIITLLIQYLLHILRKDGNLTGSTLWVGTGVVIILCMFGIIKQDTNYFASIIGYVSADEIGKSLGWHL